MANDFTIVKTVGENEWISKIAKQIDPTNRDGGEKLWSTNPQLVKLTGNNRHVLEPGWELKLPPPPSLGNVGGIMATLNKDKLRPRPKKQLVLTFLEYLGEGRTSVECDVYVGNSLVFNDSSMMGNIVIPFIHKDKTVFDELTTTVADLVVQVHRLGKKHGPPQHIKLHIGGLTPLTLKDGKVSVTGLQKILNNLGYEPGKADGIYGFKTQAAVRAFQADHHLPVTNVPDKVTCGKLLEKSVNPMRKPEGEAGEGDSAFPGYQDPRIEPATGTPLELRYTQFFETGAMWDPYDGWIDRAAPDPVIAPNGDQTAPNHNYEVLKGDKTGLKAYDKTRIGSRRFEADIPKEGIRFFPKEVYVAPSDDGDKSNSNPIWMLKYRSAFLDCGRWLEDHCDFAVLIGWHAYLCKYVPKERRSGAGPKVQLPRGGSSQRLDHIFFEKLGNSVEVVKCVSAVWASDKSFDWHTLTVVIPDLHLMTGIAANVWKHTSRDEAGPYNDLRAELRLLTFARELQGIAQLKQNLNIVQIGDTYDLWVGSPAVLGHDTPLFEANKSSSVKLEKAANIHFGAGLNYQDNKQQVVDHWAECIDPNFDPTSVDMRVQVLQWWTEAIMGKRNSPLDQAGIQGEPKNMPWVEWILERRTTHNSTKRNRLNQIRRGYVSGSLDGRTVAQLLAKEFPEQFDHVPEKPFMNGPSGADRVVMVSSAQPESDLVHNWLNSVQRQLVIFEQETAHYVKYKDSDLDGQWLNPAEAALWIFGEYGIKYLYGNHDSYLILDEVRGSLIDERVRIIDDGHGVFIEHAQRLELGLVGATATLNASANYDGCTLGFELTNGAFQGKSVGIIPGATSSWTQKIFGAAGDATDANVAALSQVFYRREAGRFFVARAVTDHPKLPHIFVIGHTHAPLLELNYVHLNDAMDIGIPVLDADHWRGPGVGI